MFPNRNKLTALIIVFLSTCATGAGYTGQVPDRLAGKPESPAAAAKKDDGHDKPAPGRMFVVGRVLDPQRKPVANASVMVYARFTAHPTGHSGRWLVREGDWACVQRWSGATSGGRPPHLVVAS